MPTSSAETRINDLFMRLPPPGTHHAGIDPGQDFPSITMRKYSSLSMCLWSNLFIDTRG